MGELRRTVIGDVLVLKWILLLFFMGKEFFPYFDMTTSREKEEGAGNLRRILSPKVACGNPASKPASKPVSKLASKPSSKPVSKSVPISE